MVVSVVASVGPVVVLTPGPVNKICPAETGYTLILGTKTIEQQAASTVHSPLQKKKQKQSLQCALCRVVERSKVPGPKIIHNMLWEINASDVV